jgi:hypothetical protein
VRDAEPSGIPVQGASDTDRQVSGFCWPLSGEMSGKISLPDIDFIIGISDLSGECRKCRVLRGERRVQESRIVDCGSSPFNGPTYSSDKVSRHSWSGAVTRDPVPKVIEHSSLIMLKIGHLNQRPSSVVQHSTVHGDRVHVGQAK